MSEFKELIKKRKKVVGGVVRAVRRSKDITQNEIAQALGVSQPSFIQKIEAGVRHLDVSELWELCNLMKISFVEMTQKIDEAIKKE